MSIEISEKSLDKSLDEARREGFQEGISLSQGYFVHKLNNQLAMPVFLIESTLRKPGLPNEAVESLKSVLDDLYNLSQTLKNLEVIPDDITAHLRR